MKTSLFFKSILLVQLLVWKADSQLSPSANNEAMTSSGPVRGTEIQFNGHTLQQYLGIPFAKPPVNDLRFKKPQPVEAWTETYVADRMPPACIQYIEYPFPWYDFQNGKSEDCLYLNIWVPKSSPNDTCFEKKPVIFWIYGGGFTVGSNRKPLYNGQALAAEGKVVVVTINYRMGAFGFLTSGTDTAPGNIGVYDMLEALKWVNKNIAAFGGDPDQVTLAGGSAGAISIGLFCVSPLTKGLFKRVIMESGSPAYLSAENNTANIEKTQKLAEALGCANGAITVYDNPEEVFHCLRSIDAFTIAKTLNSYNPHSTLLFFPMYGDELLPMNARIALINGNFHNVDVLIGNNLDEDAFRLGTAHPEVFGFHGEKNPNVNKSYGESLIREDFSDFPDPDAVIQYYLGGLADNDYYMIRKQVYIADSDYIFICPDVYFAESLSKAGNKVYYYFFVHRPSTTPWADWMGVVHFEEIQFVFGLPLQNPESYTSAEVSLSRRMIKIWSSFAKKGNTGYIDWPSYSRENPTYMTLDTKRFPKYGKGPHKKNCDFFRKYFGFD